MQDHPEINIENLYERYHEKGVLVLVDSKPRPATYEGTFFVGPNSKWMRIDIRIGTSPTGIWIIKEVYISQKIAESITPAPTEVLDSYEGRIAFVIPTIVLPALPE